MPLTQKITLKMRIQKLCRLQIPTVVRSLYKIEAGEVIKVGINASNLGKGWQYFYAKIIEEGRFTIPKLAASQLQREKESLPGKIFEVTLEPP